ncbi:MAG: hypothetical protein FWE95_05230 [Planctomycetaceae bacterium]|nr:hypothetical protein [Planctomycetaceae bacterium]
MKSPKLLAIVFVLLFTLPSHAQSRFDIESAWFVANNEWLVDAKMFTKDLNLTFPDEIPADAMWCGATVTDGKIVGTIIALPLKEGAIIDHESFSFRLNLRRNAVIAAAFPTGSSGFQILQRDSILYLFSPGISQKDIDALRLETNWEILQRQTHLGFVQYYPERFLLPTLPPEQEGESEFIKRVRKRSADDYKDGQYTGTADSLLLGLRVLEGEFKVIWEKRHVAGVEPSNDVASLPFPFGGFVDPDASFSVAFRLPFGKESFKDWLSMPFGGTIGMKVTPPEERENDRRYVFSASTIVTTRWSEESGYNLIRNGNLGVRYPKQPEDRLAEEGVLSNEELDKMNEEIAHSTLALLVNVRDSLLSMDWSQPLDVAILSEDEVGYLALAYPPAEMQIDWSLAVQLMLTVADSMRQTAPEDTLYDVLDTLFQMVPQEMSGTVAGLTCYRLNLLHENEGYSIVFALEPGIIYAAVSGNEVSEEQHAAIQRQLERKIEASRQSVVEGMSPPTTVFRANLDDTKLRADFETTSRGYRVSVYVTPESFGTVLALGQQFGMGQLLPFLQ